MIVMWSVQVNRESGVFLAKANFALSPVPRSQLARGFRREIGDDEVGTGTTNSKQ